MNPASPPASPVASAEANQTGQLAHLLYEELRSMAGNMMRRAPPGHTLQATALVHEAFLRLARSQNRSWDNHAHFFGAAAEAMRRILIEDARRKMTQRRGGGWQRLNLDQVQVAMETDAALLLAVNDALEKLGTLDALKAQVVKLRFFGGLSIEEVGEAMGLAERTVRHHWTFARAWLYQEITDTGCEASSPR